MGFTFLNSYVNSSVCAQYSYFMDTKPTQTRLRCSYVVVKNSTIVIANWLTVTKYLFLEWQWIVSVLRRYFFLSPSATRLLPGLTIWVTWRVSYKKQELITFREHLASLRVFVETFNMLVKDSVGLEFVLYSTCELEFIDLQEHMWTFLVHSSLICGFWWPLSYLLNFLKVTDYHYLSKVVIGIPESALGFYFKGVVHYEKLYKMKIE